MADVLSQIRNLNDLGARSVAEPFAGGAGATLRLLTFEETHEIFINDADPAIFDFWWSLISRPRPFMERLWATPVSMAEWLRQRETYRGRRPTRLARGFATFYLNRCNRSGIIINGGPIGGMDQTGRWKIDARFNKENLQLRCERIVEYGERIHVSGEDGIEFIKQLDAGSTFFFIDPPYFMKGESLYLNSLDEDYHASLAEELKSMRNDAWVLTYDDCPQIRQLYKGWTTIKPFSMRYSASQRRAGQEVLIAPKWLRLPETQNSSAINW